MADVAPSSDHTANIIKNLTLEPQEHKPADSQPADEVGLLHRCVAKSPNNAQESPDNSTSSTKEKSQFSDRIITPFFPRVSDPTCNSPCGYSACCYYGCCTCFGNYARPNSGSHNSPAPYGGYWSSYNYGGYGYRPYGSFFTPTPTPTPSPSPSPMQTPIIKSPPPNTQKSPSNSDTSDEKVESKANAGKATSKVNTPSVGYNYPAVCYGSAYQMYPNKYFGYNFYGYDPRMCNAACFSNDSFKLRGPPNADCLDERNRGPRIDGLANQNGAVEKKTDENSTLYNLDQYNLSEFSEEYSSARFFVIKSYSEDDIHKSIKYSVWSSTPNGNKKLNSAYNEAQQAETKYPIFLLFSVNTSGQFVGLAEMVGSVDFNRNVEFWQQDKWTGCLPVKWHIVKDVSNNLLRHITLENNENKPVTNSRDTQEVMLSQGIEIIKILKNHVSKTCILDDFKFYEEREKIIVDRKAKRLQPINGEVKGSSSDSEVVSSKEEED